MNTKHISLAFAAAAALLAGCAKSPIETPFGTNGLTDLELTYVGSTEVKSVIDGTTFPTDGEIGLFLFGDEQATKAYGDGYENIKYAYNSTKKKWTANPSIKVGSTPGYLYGYYPYKSGNTDVKEIPVASSLNGDDVMYATPVKDVTDATASQTAITMNHALARVSITIKNNGYTGDAKLSKIKLSGAKIAPEGTLNALDGKITATNSDVTLDVPTANQTITATGSTYECLLVPSGKDESKQAVDLTLTIDDKDMTATLSGDNGVIIAQNTKSNITITLSNKGITVQTVSVEDWKVVEVGGYKVTVKLSEDAGIENDVYLNATTDGSSVTIKALTTLTGRFTQCTCTPAGKATCTPSTDATTGICTFTITDVQDDITAEVGYYLKCNATVEYDSDKGAVKLNGSAVASGTPVQILYGEEAVFTAEANTGYSFIKWTDGNDNDLCTDNPYYVTLTSNLTVKAIFEDDIIFEPDSTGVSAPSVNNIWAGHFTVMAGVDEKEYSDPSKVKIAYSLKGKDAWITVATTRTGEGVYRCTLNGLAPATEYDVKLVIDGTDINTINVTTAAAKQLPNWDFEVTSNAESSKWTSFYDPTNSDPELKTKFWDSGSSASAGMLGAGYAICYSDSDVSGKTASKKSVRMQSLAAAGKLAAGNLFTGIFAGLDGLNPKFNFGRPWDQYRPTAVRFWYKYRGGKVDKTASGCPLTTSDYDRFSIKVALGNWDFEKYGGTKNCPVQVNTNKTSTFWDYKKIEGTVAYCELVEVGNGSTGEWKQVTIPLDYFSTTDFPSFIVVAGTASIYGDYFAGSSSSALWIDDFELLYE